MRKTLTKEEIISLIRDCAKKLKRNPSLRELEKMTGLKWGKVSARFGGLGEALLAAGLEPRGAGFILPERPLLLDWAGVARKVRTLPQKAIYVREGHYSIAPFASRYGNWLQVPKAFRDFTRREGIEKEWSDVLDMIAEKFPEPVGDHDTLRRGTVHANRKLDRRKVRFDRPIYGPPLPLPGLAHEPVNEAGVLYLFGAVAHKLGFVVQRVQLDFPDCEAMREVGPGTWQRVRIEIEYASRGFQRHGHRKDGCDIIVCWVHNWPECPANIEVIELRKIVRAL